MIQLKRYTTFKHKDQLNDAVRRHVHQHRFTLTKTALKALDIISRYAVKYTGAAWLKNSTLSALLEKSPATTRRALAALERAGIIKRVEFLRKISGGNGANILQIQPFVECGDRPEMSARPTRPAPVAPSVPAAKREPDSLISLTKPHTKNKETLPDPVTFYEHVHQLVRNKKERREFMTAYKKQVTTLLRFDTYKDHKELLERFAIRSLYHALRRQQTGVIHNAIGYFYGTLRNHIDEALFSDMTEVYSANPDDLLSSLPY